MTPHGSNPNPTRGPGQRRIHEWHDACDGLDQYVPYASQLGYADDSVGVVTHLDERGRTRHSFYSRESHLSDQAWIEADAESVVNVLNRA